MQSIWACRTENGYRRRTVLFFSKPLCCSHLKSCRPQSGYIRRVYGFMGAELVGQRNSVSSHHEVESLQGSGHRIQASCGFRPERLRKGTRLAQNRLRVGVPPRPYFHRLPGFVWARPSLLQDLVVVYLGKKKKRLAGFVWASSSTVSPAIDGAAPNQLAPGNTNPSK